MADILDIDELKMYFREPYKVNDYITIYQPTIGDIISWGEKRYYSMIHTVTCIPSDMKSQLFDAGIDYEEISDFELFCVLVKTLTLEETSIIFGNLDFTKMEMFVSENGEKCLYDKENNILLDSIAYIKIAGYLRKLHGIKPKIEHAMNKTTKRILIQLDRERILKQKDEPYKSGLLPLISAMMRYPGFKYKSNELKECGLYEFMDCVNGSQIYIQSTTLLQGSYSGMIDTSKIPKKEFNWMRSIDD